MKTEKKQTRTVVARVEEMPPGSMCIVPVGKFGVGVYNINGEFSAIVNYCPHRGGPMCVGQLTGETKAGEKPYSLEYSREDEFIKCPWHGWEFDIATGKAVAAPVRVRTYEVVVEDGHVVLLGAG
ncbi:Rieske (2Fe-2S) protein [Rhodococcus sp. NCIMB 12038]|jgi:nitrite reductase (NADH) small subunit|uniref:Rieske (2Fe-2S) protein n=1 Tax=Rhodococcus sp. NCIMB 12038 TaxID=933800 RepID=UPI000B3C3D0E|nr:Rieske (2Fe-2S) protein [Rhodococcus sp. NCIMB 12038]OUS83973.1 (2Fe-2S)-binding protein [Rhodococcus sp. NCIMB 12038]